MKCTEKFVLVPYDKYERMLSRNKHPVNTATSVGVDAEITNDDKQNGNGDQLPPQPPPGLPNKKRSRALVNVEPSRDSPREPSREPSREPTREPIREPRKKEKRKKNNWAELWQKMT